MPARDARQQPSRHVCFVAPFGLGQKTTVWARTLPLAKEIVKQGWRATILIPPWDTPEDAGASRTEDGVQLVNVAIKGGIPATTARLLRELDARSPDLVHIVKPRAYAGLVQWWLVQRRLWQQSNLPPLVLDIDDWEQAWAPINHYSWPLARFLAWQEEWGIRHAGAITAASRWLQGRAQEYAPRTPLLYLPNGIKPLSAAESSQFSWPSFAGDPSAGATVLFFTRFVEVPPAWLAEFAASLYAKQPQMRLLIAGSPVQPGLDAPFRRQMATTAAAGSVEWLGFVPLAQLPALYARTRCAIFPAANVPLQQAKCSVRLATTLLQGIPVVASAVGEQAAYGANGAACLVGAEATPSQFAAAVEQVLTQPPQQSALGAAARTHLLQHYNWRHLAQRLVDFYTNLLA